MGEIKLKVGVISGKGGVGKSTVTSLLAVELKRKGYEVGILDIDITGSSIPQIFGVSGKPSVKNKKMIPLQTKKGIKILATNLLLDNPSDPILWRGPLISKAIMQFVRDVDWGDLDILLVDFPPGTSDAFISALQLRLIHHALFVSTPHELSNLIVEKTIKASKKLGVKFLGLVENMGEIVCPYCGKKFELFGKKVTKRFEDEYDIKTLAKIPIEKEIIELERSGKIEDYSKNYLENIVKLLEEKIKERE